MPGPERAAAYRVAFVPEIPGGGGTVKPAPLIYTDTHIQARTHDADTNAVYQAPTTHVDTHTPAHICAVGFDVGLLTPRTTPRIELLIHWV